MLLAPQREDLSHSASIYIPPGPRLGKQVVEAKGVRKGFGERTLIEDLSFSLPPGGIVGIVGPNGAGKTTLVRMLMGEEQPDEGELIVGAAPPHDPYPQPRPVPNPSLKPSSDTLARNPSPNPNNDPNSNAGLPPTSPNPSTHPNPRPNRRPAQARA